MSKTRDTGFINNVVKYDANGNVSIVSGSTTLLSISSSGAITTTGVISGSNALSASYAQTGTSASYAVSATSASYALSTTSASYAASATSASYALSSSFAYQAQTASSADAFTVRNTLTAQTLVVQTITSSVVYSSGSNIFGNTIANTHQFTGSILTSGSVGIGTSSPTGRLEVAPLVQAGAEGIFVNQSGSYQSTIRFKSGHGADSDYRIGASILVNNAFEIYSLNATASRLVITNSGSVGIGTTSPNEKLEVFSSEVAGTSQQTRLRISQAASVSSRVNLVAGVISGSNPYFAIEARQSASPFSIVERLRIDGNGNIGIGTTSPLGSDAEKTLHLSDNGAGYTTLYVTNGANTLRGIFAVSNANSTISVGTQTNHDLRLVTNDSVKMFISNSGNIGIGTTNPLRRLHVPNDGSNWISGIFGGAGGTDVTVVGNLYGPTIGGHNSTLTAWAPLLLNPDGGNVGIGLSNPATTLNVGHNGHGIGFSYLGSSTLPSLAGLYTSDGTAGGQTGYGSLLLKARTDYGGYYSLNFFTAASNNVPLERMRISSGGIVTKPYQPAFRAGRSSSYTPGASTTIVFNSTSGFGFNVGGHYSTSTGRFTAPVDGIYTFTTCVIWESVGNSQGMDDAFEIKVNGTTAAYSFRRATYISGTTGISGYYTDHATVILNLTAGQYVEVVNRWAGLTVHGNQNYCWFTGYLL